MIRTWWALRDLPNVAVVHFDDLKHDLAGTIAKLALFLDIEQPPEVMARVQAHCTFDYMKAHAEQLVTWSGRTFQGGGATFINKGINGRWRDALSAAEVAAYEAGAVAELGQIAHIGWPPASGQPGARAGNFGCRRDCDRQRLGQRGWSGAAMAGPCQP